MKIDFIHLDSVTSTNTWAKENHANFNPSHLTCITAKTQTAGRGRQDKKWISPPGSLYLTLYFTVPSSAPYLSNLGQIMALACAELLITFHLPAEIKWPNDILVHNKKIGGILTETISLLNSTGVILGLGLNVNMPEEILQSINKPATSLQADSSSLLTPLLNLFVSHLTLLQQKGFAPFQKRFNELLALKGETISVHLPHQTIEGVCDSITPEGLLKLRLLSGKFQTFSTGEIL